MYYSTDGMKWNKLVDKSNSKTDMPHEYVELTKSVQARFIKLENIHMPQANLPLADYVYFEMEMLSGQKQ